MKNSKDERSKMMSISIPETLHEKMKEQIEGTGFPSVSSYISHILTVLFENETSSEKKISKKDEERIKSRLRALGYID